MTLRRLLESIEALRTPAPAPRPTGGGLAWGDVYPSLRPPGINPRTYPATRSVASSTDSVILALANPARRALSIVNDGTANLYVNLGAVASSGSFTSKLPAGATFVIEGPDVYRGDVAGVWDALSGFARIREQT